MVVILSVSWVVLLAVLMLVFFRKDGLKPVHAVVCALFGFYLSGTALAPGITAGGESLASLLGGFGL
ncbi:membrane protein [Streptomyces xiamenensis]|uniref:Membrane protein n=1 Tax=Streptomyces xiamenensis TaxID=408015 RepID=A0A0F7G221_9ACTN|nr:membrane protein [Streptomyces xiamenensis]